MLKLSAICAAALISASVAAAEGDLAGQDIRIGVAGPLTTPSATFGVEMRQAVDLAIDERNAAGGVLGGKDRGGGDRRSGGPGEGKGRRQDALRRSSRARGRRPREQRRHARERENLRGLRPADSDADGLQPRHHRAGTRQRLPPHQPRRPQGSGSGAVAHDQHGQEGGRRGRRRHALRQGRRRPVLERVHGRRRRRPHALDGQGRADGFRRRSRGLAEGFRRAVLRRHQGRRLYPQGHAKGRFAAGVRLRRRLLERRRLHQTGGGRSDGGRGRPRPLGRAGDRQGPRLGRVRRALQGPFRSDQQLRRELLRQRAHS